MRTNLELIERILPYLHDLLWKQRDFEWKREPLNERTVIAQWIRNVCVCKKKKSWKVVTKMQ